MQPASIKTFDMVFALSVVAQGVGVAIAESNRNEQFWAFLVYLVIAVPLWFFASRRASNVARWLMTLFLAAQIVASVMVGLSAAFWATDNGLMLAATLLTYVVMIVMLFRSDSNAWFAGKPTDTVETA